MFNELSIHPEKSKKVDTIPFPQKLFPQLFSTLIITIRNVTRALN